MDQLGKLREEIDDLDERILELLNRRAKVAMEIGHLKKVLRKPFYVPSRERAIFERLRSINPGPFPSDAIDTVFREIISASLSLEYPMKVVYLGPKATFTHVAALQKFGKLAQLAACKSISSVFDEVASGRALYGVVPIENSNEGAVTHTLDMFLESDLKIIEEHYLEISHDLLVNDGELGDVRRIYSHPQALDQCRRWIEDHLPHAQQVVVTSTARAAQIVADEPNSAAIASRHAANLYKLRVLESNIQDNHENYTRFLVIGRDLLEPTGHDRTSILFGFKDRPGVLGEMLEPFKNRSLNLMKIESRPIKKKAWEYVFFLDIEGHVEDGPIKEAIKELDSFATLLKVLGSFRRAR
ncbi:prephenate dehydratase [Acanthopleuribacter pedis]|uniref:Bifunctional chorismate mutase/prephenate dehydratase n=1 Tax=Acanthopleuribacter pedis TaxID=442870 RepID=A0A8J7U6C7_9BACT|nr:prephenate dehydratase [Acanthopleuribacter pedis]MBO1322652.1 prephenate dehydratase [Acanthopleuribacter pedis]